MIGFLAERSDGITAWFMVGFAYIGMVVTFYAASCYTAGKYPERNRE